MISADQELLPEDADVHQVQAVPEEPHDEHAGEDAEHRAAAAEEAGAADDHGRDGVELGADAGIREAGIGAAGKKQRRKARRRSRRAT